jgi:YVTN family beta-propeller protein
VFPILFAAGMSLIDTTDGVMMLGADLPHGVWPSADGTRVYVGLENADVLAAIDTLTNKVIATSPMGQGAQALIYVPNAVPDGDGTQNLEPLGLAGMTTHLKLASPSPKGGQAPTACRCSIRD